MAVDAVAAYAFNETAGTTAADATGHAIVGTLVNGPTWTAGKYGNAIGLDGVNDYVNLGNPTALQLTGSVTLSGWIYASAFPGDDAAVISKRASGETGFQLDVTKDWGPRTIGFKLTNSSGGQMFRYGATTLQLNTWYYIAGVYDAATQSLHVYLNGQLDDGVLQGTVTTSQQNSTNNVTIGRRSGTAGFEFPGRIDDVRIYNRALTATEIQIDMVTALGTSAPDTIAPTVQTINRVATTPTNAGSVQWTVTFSESVSSVDLSDFALAAGGISGAAISTVTGSGATYTVTASTGTGSGTLGLNLVDNDSIQDLSANRLGGTGQGNGAFTGQVYTVDKTVPTGTLVINGGAAATNSRNVTLSLSASDTLSSVTQMRFSNTGTSFSAAEVYAPTKAWTLTAGAGTKTVYVQYKDGPGNWSTAAITDTIVLDTAAPTISARTATNITSSSTTITWTTNEVSTSQVNYGLTTSYGLTTALDSTLLTAHSVALAGLAPNTTYHYRVRSRDAAGNESVSANTTFVTTGGADTVAPTVQMINRAGTSPTNAGSVQWTVTFSESVTGVDTSDFALAANGISGATISAVSSSGTTYTVTASTGINSGTLGLNLVDNDSIQDLSANRLGGTGAGNGNFTGQIYTLDKVVPIVSAIARVNASPSNSTSVQWSVTFSESVTGVDAADFALAASGITGATINNVSGSGATYTVTASTGTGSGTLGLNLVDNDSILDLTTNRLGGTGVGNGAFTGQVYAIDKSVPSVHLHEPADGAVVSEIVVVEADAMDNLGVAGVQFYVDGVLTGSLDTAEPYALTWDTRTVSNGVHSLTARAYDTAGNSTLSSPVTVNVSNVSSFRNEILATGFDLPTVVKFLPDGRLLVAEIAGTIKILAPPYTTVASTPFLELNLNIPGYAGIQQGIMDVVLDPNFVSNHYYYVFYTKDVPNRDRLSRFTANSTLDGTIAGSELILYQDPQDADTEHHGGAINFGNDGKIYVTTGDHFQGLPAQDLTSPRGKILRFNSDGTVPTDNPFYDGAGPNYDAIWAYGLRNPFRAYYDAPTGRLFVGEVGGNVWSTAKEEINLGVRGANYGWPNVEGTSTNPNYTNPLYSYAHVDRDAAVTGGFVYHGSQFPNGYQGNYFFADYTQNWIKRLTLDANGNVTGVFNFEPADGSADGPYGDIVYLTEGPDGALYYLDLGYSDISGQFGVSKLRRIQYLHGNLPPVVAASATPGAQPLTFSFSSAGSSDPEGLPLTYSWTFGDGQSSTAANPQHTYATAGLYQARLTVSDGVNFTLSPPISVSAGNQPVIMALNTTPANNGLFRAGDVISFSATATDTEDGALPASAFTWNVDFLHGGHVHPGSVFTGVTGGTFTIPTSGHDFSGDTRYRITLTVTDSHGLQATQAAQVYPEKVDLSFNTAPGGLTLYLDGIAHTAPFVYDTLIGFTHTIEARDQTVSTSSYTFASWSDGGARQHAITVSPAAQAFTANYTLVTNPLPAGLAAGWSFNEASGTSATDSSGNNNTATLVNDVARTAGNYGGGLTFDGVNDYLSVPNSASLNIAGSGLTLSMWIKPQALSSGDSVVLGKFWNTTMTSPFYQYGLELAGGTTPIFYLGTTTGGLLSASMGSALTFNVWTHLAVVFDGAQARYYRNGVLVSTVAMPGTITARGNPFRIGADNNTQQFFNGSLDEVRIYNRALTAQEVQNDMASPG